MFQKVVINKQYGGFNLSKKALELYKLKSKHDNGKPICYSLIPRNDPHLIEAIEEIGLAESSGSSGCTLKIVQVPVGVEWNIEEFDGVEWVAEQHEVWYPQDNIPQDMTGKKAVVINVAYGGYGLSEKFLQFYKSETGVEAKYHNDIARDDPRLIECIQKYGLKQAASSCCSLAFVIVPADAAWEITEEDGAESVVEEHETWE